jgi:hypothetical protein
MHFAEYRCGNRHVFAGPRTPDKPSLVRVVIPRTLLNTSPLIDRGILDLQCLTTQLVNDDNWLSCVSLKAEKQACPLAKEQTEQIVNVRFVYRDRVAWYWCLSFHPHVSHGQNATDLLLS